MSNRDFYLFSLSFNFNLVEDDGRSPVNHDAIITSADGVTSSARAATDGVAATACAALDRDPANSRAETDGVTANSCAVIDGTPASARATTDGVTTSGESAMVEHGEK